MTSSPTDPPHPRPLVIDANVWVSALVFGGAPREVFETVVRRGLTVATSAELESETRRVVAAKFPDFADDLAAVRTALTRSTLAVRLGTITIEICRDPDDDRVLETAVLAGADTIVSGDRDLLTLRTYQGIAILTPRAWLDHDEARHAPR
ncbi:MAG: putative toxin-antitoxin system toxin component, PIN family [Microbacterium sp.]